MGSYNVIDIIFLIGIAQGFFLSIILPVIHQKNIAANKILALQLVVACLILITRMIIHKAEEIWIVQRFALLETFIFVLGPLGYIYLKRLLEINQEKFRLLWFHYAPALIYFSYLVYMNTYTNQEFAELFKSGYFRTAFFVAELSALLFNFYYWYVSVQLFVKFTREKKEQLSFSQQAISFVRVILIIIGLVIFIWLLSFVSNHLFRTSLPLVNYNSIWIAIPILIYVVGYYALKQPEIFKVTIGNEDRSKSEFKLKLDEKSIKDLKHKLSKLMTEDKIYLKNELTLVELSEKLNTSTNKLSWLLNNVYKTNFYDYINKYRINAFVVKLEQDEHKLKTLFSLSMEVGFNSKSTFNKAFKAILNETPSSYIKRIGS